MVEADVVGAGWWSGHAEDRGDGGVKVPLKDSVGVLAYGCSSEAAESGRAGAGVAHEAGLQRPHGCER